MKLTAKYIVIRNSGFLTPIIFSCNLVHADVAKGKDVKSAGFVDITCSGDIIIKTYGESISLGISSKSEDSKLIENMFNLPC